MVYRLSSGGQDKFAIGIQTFSRWTGQVLNWYIDFLQVDRKGFLLVYRLYSGGQDRFPIGLQTFFRWTGQFPVGLQIFSRWTGQVSYWSTDFFQVDGTGFLLVYRLSPGGQGSLLLV